MNALTGTLTGISEVDSEMLSFYRLRSEMLDCFADIEAAVLSYLLDNRTKAVCETAPLGQKIEAAKKVPAGPHRSKELKSKADDELAKIADLLIVRANLVHSRMEIAITNQNRLLAIFQNAKNRMSDDCTATVLSLPQLEKLVSSLETTSRSLRKALAARNATAQPRAKQSRAD